MYPHTSNNAERKAGTNAAPSPYLLFFGLLTILACWLNWLTLRRKRYASFNMPRGICALLSLTPFSYFGNLPKMMNCRIFPKILVKCHCRALVMNSVRPSTNHHLLFYYVYGETYLEPKGQNTSTISKKWARKQVMMKYN